MRVISKEGEVGMTMWIKQGQLDFRIAPKMQTVLGLAEALVFFLEGSGATTLSISILLGWPLMTLVALLAMVVATLFLLGHLGHPTRAIKAMKKLKFSWISRGTLFLGSCVAIGFLCLLVTICVGKTWTPARIILTILVCCLSAIVLVYPGFVLGYSVSIPFWHSGTLPFFFALNGVSTGLSLTLLYGVMKTTANVSILYNLAWVQVISTCTLLLVTFTHLDLMKRTGLGARLSVEALLKQEKLFFGMLGCLIGTAVPLVLTLLTAVSMGFGLILLAVSAICRVVGDLSLRYAFLKVGIYDAIY